METMLIFMFVLGYLAITLEHTIKIDKLIPALAMMALMWATISLNIDNVPAWFNSESHHLVDGFASMTHEAKRHLLEGTVLHHLGKTAEILFFLMGAMTIVEIIDYFDGFATFKKLISTTNKRKLLWIFCFIAFILSAIIDNLTATIVLVTILQKIITDRKTRMWFAGLIIIAANAGGAWSPIGDVTTTMLWIAKKVTTGQLIKYLILPSLISMAVPTLIASFMKPFKGDIEQPTDTSGSKSKYGQLMLILGLSGIVFVPIFKTGTHLPPYIGMMLSLSVIAMFAEIYSRTEFSLSDIQTDHDAEEKFHSPVHHSLSRIEMPSVLFFLGILMAVAALESTGMLFQSAKQLQVAIPNNNVVVLLLGFASAVVDNVPLVAASMGMFDNAIDDPLWHFIAYSAGTGGSMLIIGSAAGVVAMGMEKIDFMWYLKNISWLALLGFLSGAGLFILEHGHHLT